MFNIEQRTGAALRSITATIKNEGLAMTCNRCHSDTQGVFNGEFAIHFRALEGLNKAIVWVFPEIDVCLNCGFSEFTVPERELQVLSQGSPVEGAVVLGWPPFRKKAKALSPGMN